MVFISNHSEKGKHYFTFFIIISGRYLLVTFYEFIKIEDLWYRSPRRRRCNPYEPEASLCPFYLIGRTFPGPPQELMV